MRKLLAVAICSLPLAWVPTVYAQSGGSTSTGASTSTDATSGRTAGTVMEGSPAGTDAKKGDKGAAAGADNRSAAERVGGVPDKAAGSPQRGNTNAGTPAATGNDTRTSPAGSDSAPQGTTSTEATSGRTAKTIMEGSPAGTDAKKGDKGAAAGADNRSTAERVGGVPDKAAGSPQRGDTRTGSTSDTTKP